MKNWANLFVKILASTGIRCEPSGGKGSFFLLWSKNRNNFCHALCFI